MHAKLHSHSGCSTRRVESLGLENLFEKIDLTVGKSRLAHLKGMEPLALPRRATAIRVVSSFFLIPLHSPIPIYIYIYIRILRVQWP